MQVILYTLIFGRDVYHYSKSPYLASFLKSFPRVRNVELLIFGDELIPSSFKPLLRNVKHVEISYYGMVSRIDNVIGTNTSHLYKEDMEGKNYKACDFKPLIPLAFPEYFIFRNKSERRWIGWIDNDMWISNKLFQNINRLSSNINAVCMADFFKSWGPLTILDDDLYFRKLVPLVKSNSKFLQKVLLGWDQCQKYDELGEFGGFGYNYSFSYIMDLAGVNADYHSFYPGNLDDRLCGMFTKDWTLVSNPTGGQSCGYCKLVTERRRTIIYDIKGKKLTMCHFAVTKKTNLFADEEHWFQHLSDLNSNKTLVSTFQAGIQSEA